MQGPFRNISPNGKLNPRSLRRNAEIAGAFSSMDAPDGHTFEQSTSGAMLVDQRPKRHLAIIQNVYGSGSGQSGSGIVSSGRAVAADMLNAYDAIFAQWVIEDDTYVAVVQPDQPVVLAIEANGVIDVPDGAVVELLPGPGQPDFYYLFWTGEIGTGSGNDETLTVNCGDGSTTTYTIARTDDGYSATLVE